MKSEEVKVSNMSFIQRKPIVEEGDTVLLYLSMSSMYPVEITPRIKNRQGHLIENKFNTMYGMVKVMDLVGAKYGSKINLSSGWAYLLHPTCELWTKTLPHRTQIIYTPDISLIITGLDLKPGAIVLEAGTGSGSLSHALVRAIQPTGHLFTYDFHEKRVELAKEEFIKHGISQWVTVGHRDVISQGFNIDKQVDAIFLDLPSPWQVIPHIQQKLKRGGKICTFSPCIEQVQKTCETLKLSQSFILIKTQEVLQRPFSIQTRTMNSLNFTPTTAANLDPTTASSSSDGKPPKLGPIKKDQCKFRTLIPPSQIPGHTGYITFATFVSNNSAAFTYTGVTSETENMDLSEEKL